MFGPYFVVLLILCKVKALQDVLVSNINTLSELPLEKLLHVKSSLEQEMEFNDLKFEDDSNDQSISATLDNSQAQALQGRKYRQSIQRGSYETWQKKGNNKKSLSTIFQITITALAFLAFAGYLLCLLVQAIKAKQMHSESGAPTAAVYLSPIRRRRPMRQRRNVWPEGDPDALYYALKTFSEGYATYHAVDYKYYNYTVDSFV